MHIPFSGRPTDLVGRRALHALGAVTLAVALSAAACGPDEAEVDAAFEDVQAFAEPQLSCSKSCLLSVDLDPEVDAAQVARAMVAARTLDVDTTLSIHMSEERYMTLDLGGEHSDSRDAALAEALVDLRDNQAVKHARISAAGWPPFFVDVRLDPDTPFWSEVGRVDDAVHTLADVRLEAQAQSPRWFHRTVTEDGLARDTVAVLQDLTADPTLAPGLSGVILQPERLTIGVTDFRDVQAVRDAVMQHPRSGSLPKVAVHATQEPSRLGWAPDFAALVRDLATHTTITSMTQDHEVLAVGLGGSDTGRARDLYERFDAESTDDAPALALSFDGPRSELRLDPGQDPALASLDQSLRSGLGEVRRIHSRTLTEETAHTNAFVDLSAGGDPESVWEQVAAAVAAWSRAEAPRPGVIELSVTTDDSHVVLVVDAEDARLVEIRDGEDTDVRRAWERGLS